MGRVVDLADGAQVTVGHVCGVAISATAVDGAVVAVSLKSTPTFHTKSGSIIEGVLSDTDLLVAHLLVAHLLIVSKGLRMTAALLIMDVQVGIVARYGDDDALLSQLERAIAAARTAGVPVIFVRVAFRPGAPEIAASNRTFAALAGRGAFGETDPGTQIHPRMTPQDGDIVVVKKRVSAFAGSDLAEVLRGGQIDTLVLTGIATSGVVLSTLRQAADLDFRLVVLHDACADSDAEVHRVLTQKVFPRQADVVSVEDWVSTLSTTSSSSSSSAT